MGLLALALDVVFIMADRISMMFKFQVTGAITALILWGGLCVQGCTPSHQANQAPGTQVSNAQPLQSPVEHGRELYNSKGCFVCHSVDGTAKVGPSFLHLFGKSEQFEGGATGVVDENYIRESILDPKAKIVKGFQPVMPSFKGNITDDELGALAAYIKSLK